MLSCRLFAALRIPTKPLINPARNVTKYSRRTPLLNVSQRNYSAILQTPTGKIGQQPNGASLLSNPTLIKISNEINARTVTKYSIRKGKRKTVKTVVQRFLRLHWGGWVRTIAGRHKRIWKKKPNRRRRVKYHVLCNSTQSTLLNKMVNRFWRKPKYYVDDPYGPYHTREEYQYTYRKPKPYIPSE